MAPSVSTATAAPFDQQPTHNGKITKIINGRLLQNHAIVEGTYLWFQDGKFIHPQSTFFDAQREPDEIIDAKGLLVVPGYVDIQINGAFGIDFSDSDGTPEKLAKDIQKVAKGLFQYGCTSFCPTVVSSFSETYNKVLPLLRPRPGSVQDGAEILGAHIEGPFISKEKKGAHKVETFRTAKRGMAEFDDCYGPELQNTHGTIRIITVAPELEGVRACIPELVKRNMTVSIGHSASKIAQAEEAIAGGATCITHLFNAMQAFHHRDPGIIGVLGSTHLPIPTPETKRHPSPSSSSPSPKNPDPRPFYGVICDGIHVHPNSVKIAYYSHPSGAILVTDAMSAMGLPSGNHSLGGLDVVVDDLNRVYIRGTDTLAGSAITMDACVKNFVKFTSCTIVEALEAATLHPAQLLGIADKKGTLNVGGDADFLFLSDDLSVQRVFVGGEEVRL
ncbi:hypothetical protein BZG36_03074 [Bifiguratus adelaidae]|uniref:N-acetylglucosamine-6-phosphate deacetylase n=1 Tax=Bifiguratus adelaidae TaxID=1938954 RepID=A0A261XZH3_9FUNG|nr:hypothetical protein BZG36_03074 [Bifiguratus adelaidae]